MTEKDLIKKAIREIARPNGEELYAIPGLVTAVDKDANTCNVEPLNDTADILAVKLKAADGDGIVYYPKVGSVVYVVMEDKNTGFVGMFSEIENLTVKAGGESLKEILLAFVGEVENLILKTSSGPTAGLVNPLQFKTVKDSINALFNE